MIHPHRLHDIHLSRQDYPYFVGEPATDEQGEAQLHLKLTHGSEWANSQCWSRGLTIAQVDERLLLDGALVEQACKLSE